MSVVRIGATKQYSDNWENIFSGGKSSSAQDEDREAGQEVGEEEVAQEGGVRSSGGRTARLAADVSGPILLAFGRPTAIIDTVASLIR